MHWTAVKTRLLSGRPIFLHVLHVSNISIWHSSMRKFQNPACVRWVLSSFINAKFFLSTMKTSGKNFCQFVEQPPHCRSQVKGSTDWVTAAQHSNAFTSIWNLLFYCLSWAGNASEQAIYFRGALYKFSWVNEWMKCLLSHCALVKLKFRWLIVIVESIL